MKLLTKEEEQAHYNAVLKGGLVGSAVGLAIGGVGVWAATKRFPMFRATTTPFKAFLVCSSTTFGGIIQADRGSARYDMLHNPAKLRLHEEEEAAAREYRLEHTPMQRAKDWGEKNRYSIVFGSWVASMGVALGIVNRNKYLSTAQKLVQARVYAQGLTLAVLLASFALEANDATKGKGRWETVKVIDPNDPTHQHLIEKKIHHERYPGEDQWREMVEAEEERIKEREAAAKCQEPKNAQAEKTKQSQKA